MSPVLLLSIVFGYFILLLIISGITSRNNNDDETFFIGNRKSPWPLVAFGMIGTSLSGVTFISVPGVVGNLSSANQQYSYIQMVLGYLVGYGVIATVLMPLYYKLKLTSIYTYLEQRFGTRSYKTGAFYFLLSRTIGASFRLFLVTVVLQEFILSKIGVPFYITIIVALLLIWIYTFRGGIKTIVWTDSLQTTFMLLAVIVSIVYIGRELGLGLGGIISTLRESPYSQMFFWNPKPDSFFLKQFLSGVFIAIVMTGLDQDMMQKNNSCPNIRDAQKNMFVFSWILLLVNMLFVSLGALLYIYAEAKGISIPDKTDYLFPQLALNHFSPFIGVVFILGLIAAAYSSADSALTALTTSFCIDILDFEKKTSKGETNLIRTRYTVHIAFSIIVLAVILVFNYILEGDVIGNLFKAAGYTYGPLLGLYSFGLFTSRKVNDRFAPFICIAAPVLSYFLNQNSEAWLNGYQIGFEILIINGLLTFMGLWLISTKGSQTIKLENPAYGR